MARSSDDSDCEDDLVVLGTPLPELDETAAPKKPITVQDLTATDKEGRRRFHGAFTGGYSAGYFNTVGSKEGFTPSTFVSSRSQKHDDGQSNRPEDFMDDEDLEEHGIAPRKFATAGNYTSQERKRRFENVASSLTESSALDLGSALTDLVIPDYLPIGIKLLRKMGWREGQGLGPRVKTKKKKKTRRKEPSKGGSDGKKIYGCAMPPTESDSDDSDSFIPSNLSDLTFAPSDVTPIILNAKDDVKGLGYRGLDPTLALPSSHVNLFGNPVRGKKKAGKGIRGHAFGVGALEDEDDDIYAQDSLSNYDLTMRDGDDDEGQDGNFGWTAPRAHGKQKVPVSYVGKLLEGFCLSSIPLQPKKTFPPPKLPLSFKPRHWSRRRKKDEGAEDGGGGRHSKMTAVDRGLMLGETPIMNSVFDLVGSKDKSRIESAKEAIQMTKSLETSSGSHTGPVSDARKEEKEPRLTMAGPDENQQPKFLSRFVEASMETSDNGNDKGSSAPASRDTSSSLFKSALTLQPFRKEPAKQARFDQYVAGLQQKIPDPYSLVSSQRLTEWEKAKERDEFSRSARLFRPMSAMMSSRFVQGPMLDDKDQDSKMETGEKVSDEVKASEMRMFGKLTREEFEWHPDKLMCKRFNVPNPYPGSDIVGLPNVKRDKFSVFNFLSFGDYQPKETDMMPSASKDKDMSVRSDSNTSNTNTDKGESTVKPEKKKATLSSIFKVLDDPDFHQTPINSKSGEPLESKVDKDKGKEEQEEENEEHEEADVDLFRAIFKNSDSEDSEDDESKSDGKEEENESRSEDEENQMRKSTDDNDDHYDEKGENKHSVIPKDILPGSVRANTENGESSVLPSNPKTPEPSPNHPFPRNVGDPGSKSNTPAIRSRTRWDASNTNTKSVFSVLDEINNDVMPPAQTSSEIKDDPSDSEYGPALPPTPTEFIPALPLLVQTCGTLPIKPKPKDVRDKKDKERSRHRHKDKHKYRKDKKKKSKHKSKKERKHNKKSKKSSKSRRSKVESSGSEADTETSDDDDDDNNDGSDGVSEKDLLNRFLQVSKMKSGKS